MKRAYQLVLSQLALIVAIGIGPLLDHHQGLPLLGSILFVIGTLILLPAFAHLGRTLKVSPIPKETGKLVTHGIYAYARHPIYVGLFFMAIGFTIYFASLFSAISTLLLIVILNMKASLEEKLLHQKYGTAYEAYCKKTKKFLIL